ETSILSTAEDPIENESHGTKRRTAGEDERQEPEETYQTTSSDDIGDEGIEEVFRMWNKVQRDSSYPQQSGIRFHGGVAQSGNSEQREWDTVEQQSIRESAREKRAVVIQKFSERGCDDLCEAHNA